MKNSVALRLILAFGSVIVLFGVATLLGIAQLSSFDAAVGEVTGEQLRKLELANSWIYELQETARHTRNMLILDDKDKIRQELEGTQENKAKRKDDMEKLQQLVRSPEEKQALQVVIDAPPMSPSRISTSRRSLTVSFLRPSKHCWTKRGQPSSCTSSTCASSSTWRRPSSRQRLRS